MNAPLISVNMIVHNARHFVGDAVMSILGQSFSDFEFIIVDDGSTDGTLEILRPLAERSCRIRLISRPNAGISKSRNECLANSSGKYVAIMDADDLAEPNRLTVQYEFLESNQDVLCVGAWYRVIDNAGRYLTTLKPPIDNHNIQEELLRGNTSICQPASMLRRDAIVNVGGFDDQLAPSEDLDLYLRLGEKGNLANIPEVLLDYRIHDSSASARTRLRQYECSRLACQRAWERRALSGELALATPWRPGADRKDRHDWLLKCGWWAYQSGQRRTAFLYGVKAICLMPHRLGGWRLMVCSALKDNEQQAT